MFQSCSTSSSPPSADDDEDDANVAASFQKKEKCCSSLLHSCRLLSSPTKNSPILTKEEEDAALPARILIELVGAQHLIALPLSGSANNNIEVYCSVQFGLQTVHRTAPASCSSSSTSSPKNNTSYCAPIWSIRERNLVVISITRKDLCNQKNLVVTLWGRATGRRRNMRSSSVFLGKIQLKSLQVLELAVGQPEQRIVRSLVDDLGRPMNNNNNNDTTASLALRFRVATAPDVLFVQAWNSNNDKTINLQQQHEAAAQLLVTELPESQVQGAQLRTTLMAASLRTTESSSVSGSSSPTKDASSARVIVRRIKPCPDPELLANKNNNNGLTKSEFEKLIEEPSRQWITAGGSSSSGDSDDGSLGKLYVEVLSCHNLPNVDYGSTVGNVTDAFVTACCGDVLVQTDIIDDELSPHWPPWSKRAFCLDSSFTLLRSAAASVLYVSVFGFKRGSSGLVISNNHVPIGRIEINLTQLQHHNTEYDLYYQLSKSSHVFTATASTTTTSTADPPTIRLRLRLECHNPRAALLAALPTLPAPLLHHHHQQQSASTDQNVYINVQRKKSLAVARYTCRGEYDNEQKFSLTVISSYMDEVKDGFLRRLLYSVSDATQTVIFWRSQPFSLFLCGCGGELWLPLHSMLLFGAGILLVERPTYIPAFVCFGVAWILLANLQQRRLAPSPWHRACFSYWDYLQILLFNKLMIRNEFEKVDAGEGWEEQKAVEEALRKRIREDALFSQRKEAVEKQLELDEDISIDTKTKAAIVPVELLVELGKIQGIVGSFCRLCRSIDAVITWETPLSFWATTAFLFTGFVFLFLPWAFLLKWTCRIAVLILLGPQNKLIDLYRTNNPTEETILHDLFAERMFRARCRQEDVGNLKAFRRILYGKYATAVPPSSYTLYNGRPLAKSTARVVRDHVPKIPGDSPVVPGQKLYGRMIPRPRRGWLMHQEESRLAEDRLKALIPKLDRLPAQRLDSSDTYNDDDLNGEEGVEVSDVYDLEGGRVETESTPLISPRQKRQRKSSLYGDWGVEAVDEYDDEAQFVRKSWRGSSTRILNSAGSSSSSSDSEGTGAVGDSQQVAKSGLLTVFSYGSDNASRSQEARAGIPHGDSTSKHAYIAKEEVKTSAADRDGELTTIESIGKGITRESVSEQEGVEPVDLFQEEAAFVEKSWRRSSPDSDGVSSSRSFDDNDKETDFHAADTTTQPNLPTETDCDKDVNHNDEERKDEIRTAPALPGASSRELGIEIEIFSPKAAPPK